MGCEGLPFATPLLMMEHPQHNVQSHTRVDRERAYYALQAKVYRVFAPFYDAVVLPARPLRRAVAALIPSGAKPRCRSSMRHVRKAP